MDMEFSKNIEEYKKKGWKGISSESIVLFLICVVICAAVIYICVYQFGIDIMNAVYISIPFVMPICMVGFNKQRGYRMIDVIKRKKEIRGYSKKLEWISTEAILTEESEEFEEE